MIRSEALVLLQAIFGAGKEIRTLDPNLGKVMLYHWAIPAESIRND